MSDLKTKEDYKNYKLELHRQMVMKQQVPYKIKVKMAQDRIDVIEGQTNIFDFIGEEDTE